MSKDPDRNQRVLASQSTMPDASTRASASGLLDLPAELREHIYLFATADVDQLRTTYPGSSETVVIPPLAQTSHQLRTEVLASLFRCSTLIVTLQNEADAEVARTFATSSFMAQVGTASLSPLTDLPGLAHEST